MNALVQILTNPAIVSLCIGFVIGLYHLFDIPEPVSNIITLYLVFSIGLKGGLCLGQNILCSGPLYSLASIGVCIGLLQPFIYYFLLTRITKLNRQTQVTIATQYGSISIVTFVAALTFLQQQSICYDSFMPAIAGLMEIPAIISGLLILKGAGAFDGSLARSLLQIIYNILRTKKISFIFLGFFVGYIARLYAIDGTADLFLLPFAAALILFMIDIGIKIAGQRAYIHEFTWSLIAFGIYVPIISGILSIVICSLLALSVGTTVLFAVLIGSASYIAVPAIMSSQAPQAKEVIYLPLALGITLPFNVICGIPLFYYLALYIGTLH